MNPISQNLHSMSQDALARTDRAQSEHVGDEARAKHQAALFRGRTNFAYARSAHAKVLGNMRLADWLRDRLAQARRRKTNKLARFAVPRKAVVRSLRQPGPHSSTRRGGLSRPSGSRITRDGRRGGRHGSNGEQQSSQQDGKKRDQGEHQQKHKRESDKRFIAYGVPAEALPGNTAIPDWLAIALSLDTGAAREQAVADACCDQLLALRDEIAASPEQRCDARMYRLAREVMMARTWLGASSETGFGRVRERLVERALLHGAATGLPKENRPPLVTGAGTRLGNFNLLLGLQLFNLGRNLVSSRAGRAANALASLEAGASTERDDGSEGHTEDISKTSAASR